MDLSQHISYPYSSNTYGSILAYILSIQLQCSSIYPSIYPIHIAALLMDLSQHISYSYSSNTHGSIQHISYPYSSNTHGSSLAYILSIQQQYLWMYPNICPIHIAAILMDLSQHISYPYSSNTHGSILAYILSIQQHYSWIYHSIYPIHISAILMGLSQHISYPYSSNTYGYILSKGFDCHPHAILINKLKQYGLYGQTLQLIHNHLSNRKQQCAKLGSSLSKGEEIYKGVPQVLILGPGSSIFW